jgi:hypothetical protein
LQAEVYTKPVDTAQSKKDPVQPGFQRAITGLEIHENQILCRKEARKHINDIISRSQVLPLLLIYEFLDQEPFRPRNADKLDHQIGYIENCYYLPLLVGLFKLIEPPEKYLSVL